MAIRIPSEYQKKVHPAMMEAHRTYPSMVFPAIVTSKAAEFDSTLDIVDRLGLMLMQSMNLFSMFSLFVRPQDIQTLVSQKNVLYVEPDLPKFAIRFPNINDLPPFPRPPGLPFMPPIPYTQTKGQTVPADAKKGYFPTTVSGRYIGADKAEAEGFDGSGVTVAILDTGIFEAHPQVGFGIEDINAMLPITLPNLPGFEMFGKPNPGLGIDDNGHGTHVITTIAGNLAKSPLGLECKGMAPRAKVISIKVLGTPLGMGQTSDVLKGMEMAIQRGAQVVNMSLGSEGGDNTYPECRIINAHPEVIWCVAAGNSGPGSATVGTPGCADGALTVGSISMTDKTRVSYFSSRGPTLDGRVKPDIACPGGGRFVAPDILKGEIDEYIYSGSSLGTVLDSTEDKAVDAYAALMGTSMATPHSAGIIALAVQAGQVRTRADIIDKLIQAYGDNKNNDVGYGLLTWSVLKTNPSAKRVAQRAYEATSAGGKKRTATPTTSPPPPPFYPPTHPEP